jgi:hypothetical protein
MPSVDIDIEAEAAPSDSREARVVPHPDFNVLNVPARAILANVRAGEAYATAYAREGLVVHDDGSFRDALIALEEEGGSTNPPASVQPTMAREPKSSPTTLL